MVSKSPEASGTKIARQQTEQSAYCKAQSSYSQSFYCQSSYCQNSYCQNSYCKNSYCKNSYCKNSQAPGSPDPGVENSLAEYFNWLELQIPLYSSSKVRVRDESGRLKMSAPKRTNDSGESYECMKRAKDSSAFIRSRSVKSRPVNGRSSTSLCMHSVRRLRRPSSRINHKRVEPDRSKSPSMDIVSKTSGLLKPKSVDQPQINTGPSVSRSMDRPTEECGPVCSLTELGRCNSSSPYPEVEGHMQDGCCLPNYTPTDHGHAGFGLVKSLSADETHGNSSPSYSTIVEPMRESYASRNSLAVKRDAENGPFSTSKEFARDQSGSLSTHSKDQVPTASGPVRSPAMTPESRPLYWSSMDPRDNFDRSICMSIKGDTDGFVRKPTAVKQKPGVKHEPGVRHQPGVKKEPGHFYSPNSTPTKEAPEGFSPLSSSAVKDDPGDSGSSLDGSAAEPEGVCSLSLPSLFCPSFYNLRQGPTSSASPHDHKSRSSKHSNCQSKNPKSCKHPKSYRYPKSYKSPTHNSWDHPKSPLKPARFYSVYQPNSAEPLSFPMSYQPPPDPDSYTLYPRERRAPLSFPMSYQPASPTSFPHVNAADSSIPKAVLMSYRIMSEPIGNQPQSSQCSSSEARFRRYRPIRPSPLRSSL